MKQGKVWGETEEIFVNGTVSVNYLTIKEGGFCSKHKHNFKSNRFYVINGGLKVKIWTKEGIEDETALGPGESCNIEPGVFHQFKAPIDTECIEIYEAKLHEPDIERKSTGGIEK